MKFIFVLDIDRFRSFEQFGDSPAFGVNATPDIFGKIKVGDPVYAIKKN